MGDTLSWDGQAKHGLQLLGYNRMADVSCDEIIEAIARRERRVWEIKSPPGKPVAANEHARLTGIELPNLRKLAAEKDCTDLPN